MRSNKKNLSRRNLINLDEALYTELKQILNSKRLSKTKLFQEKLPYPEDIPFDWTQMLSLHRAVLDRALLDMFSPQKEIRDEVFLWLDLENDSFLYSCERAGLPAIDVYRIFKEIKNFLKNSRTMS